AAQQHLRDVAEHDWSNFDDFIADTVAAVHRPDDGSLRRLIDVARPVLTQCLHDLDTAAARDVNDYQNLHQVRIAGKRLRYAMEVFVDCFAAPFRAEIYPRVEEMQEILGRANDSHVAAGRLESLREWLRTHRPAEWKRF